MKLFWLVIVLIPGLVRAGEMLSVSGSATTRPSQWSVDQLKNLPSVPTTQISYQGRDVTHYSTCVSLVDVLHAAGISTEIKMDPKADPKTKHPELRIIVTVRGGDGYAVVFSLAELLPAIGHRAAWLALDEDDQPLSDRDAPIKLIVPDDTKPARWVHGVNAVSVDAPAASK